MSIYLPENQYANINAFYSFQMEEFHMPEHAHNSCEIMYIADGSCKVELGSQFIKMNAKHFVFIDQNIPHRLLVEKGIPCTILNLEFSCSPDTNGVDLFYIAQRASSFQRFLGQPQEYQLLIDSENIFGCLKDLINVLEKKQFDNQYLIDLMFHQLLIILSKCEKNSRRQAGTIYINKAKNILVNTF